MLVASVLASCASDNGSAGRNPRSPRDDYTSATIETADDTIRLNVEIADSPSERARGLMHRESLPEDRGMLFVYPHQTTGGYWMKNTLIPLSIAFFDQDGEIVSILDMEPCRRDPCDIYDPGIPYWGALEVNQGAFESWDVSTGDVITWTQ
jgi:uncharacterized membrane protein (UPF0127 family)